MKPAAAVLLAAALLVGACAMPVVQGPHYEPRLAGTGAWIPAGGKGGDPPYRLRIGPAESVFMEIVATADEENFLLGWHFSCGTRRCRVEVADGPLVVEDGESGARSQVETVRRIFRSGTPAVDLAAGVARALPATARLPEGERLRTLAIPLRHDFDGPLPDRVRIELPRLTIGGREFRLPPLELARRDSGNKIREYVPVRHTSPGRTAAYADFVGTSAAVTTGGSFGMFSPATRIWFEQAGEFTVTSSFLGREDLAPPVWTRPFIAGEIRLLVRSGAEVRLAADAVDWQQGPAGTPPVAVPIRFAGRSGNLAMYTSRIDDFTAFHYPDRSEVAEQAFLAVVPKFHPKQVRVRFPPIRLEGQPLAVDAVVFDDRPGGVGMAVWP